MKISKKWLEYQHANLACVAGNGKNVPEYELVKDKDFCYDKIQLKKDPKTGKQLYHSLYLDIQSSSGLNDYKKCLRDNKTLFNRLSKLGPDMKNMSDGVDLTKFGEFSDMVAANQKINNKFGDNGLDKLKSMIANKQEELYKLMKQKKEMDKELPKMDKNEKNGGK